MGLGTGMKAFIEVSLTWRERLLSWPWKPWVKWRVIHTWEMDLG